MARSALILNAGSSSLKCSVFELGGPQQLVRLSASTFDSIDDAVRFAANHVPDLVAVGHRIVHGGAVFTAPVMASEDVLTQLETLVPLAPLHQPQNLALVRAMARALPRVPQVLCFDTAFHRTQPPVAQLFGLPVGLFKEGVRRYGFHGLSYEYIVRQLRFLAPAAATGRVIVAHLGNGASLCALSGGASVATTMGFTALDGLPMGTRCGSLDPGVVLHLLREKKMSTDAVMDLLYKHAGLLGLSGISHDMRELLASDRDEARRAVDYFVYRTVRELGSLTAALGGLDGLVFTAGIGANSPEIRERICAQLGWLGVQLDGAANAAAKSRISTSASRVSVWALPTDEELMIAHHLSCVLVALGLLQVNARP